MALTTIAGTSAAVGNTATVAGLSEVTSSSAEVEFKTIVQAKDGQGELKAMLIGKKVGTLSATGYVSTFAPPALSGAITVAGISGKIVSSNLKATAEDFAKASVTGKAVESGGGSGGGGGGA